MPSDSQDNVAGYLPNGLPFNRTGQGSRVLVIFQGLFLENKPLGPATARAMLRPYRDLAGEYSIYMIGRRPGLPRGCTIGDMGDDYAAAIRQEFGGPVDIVGTSTGGSIALEFAADHPELVRRLVIHSAAYKLGAAGARAQRCAAGLAARGDWRAVGLLTMAWLLPPRGLKRQLFKPLLCLGAHAVARDAPADAADFIVSVGAEDRFDMRDRLHEIQAPTLVVAGAQDPGYSRALFTDTAAGIRDCRLILYEGMGHPAAGKQFRRDLRAFLRADEPA